MKTRATFVGINPIAQVWLLIFSDIFSSKNDEQRIQPKPPKMCFLMEAQPRRLG